MRNHHPPHALRVGLAAAPLAVLAGREADDLPTLLGRGHQGAGALALILALAATPTATLTAAIAKLNHEGRKKMIAALGVTRLTALALLLPPLTHHYGATGAALAYLPASTTPLIPALKVLGRQAASSFVGTWAIQALLAPSAQPHGIAAALLATAASLSLLYATGVASPKEAIDPIAKLLMHIT